MAKEKLVLDLILAHLAQIRAAKFFFKNLALSVTRCHGQLSSCAISEKTNDLILRKLRDGRTDGQTDGQADKSDFIGCCQTNVKRTKLKYQQWENTNTVIKWLKDINSRGNFKWTLRTFTLQLLKKL